MWAAIDAAPTDEPSLREGLEPDQVTPGLLGFLLTFFIVIVTFFLIRDMTKRIRRVRYRGEVMERAQQENEAGDSAAERAPDGAAGNNAGNNAAGIRKSGAGVSSPRGKHGPDAELPDEKRSD